MLSGNTDRYVLTGQQPDPHPTAADALGNVDLIERYGLVAAGITTFATAVDVTISELRLEAFLPVDQASAAILAAVAQSPASVRDKSF
jgi:hypothetical protein